MRDDAVSAAKRVAEVVAVKRDVEVALVDVDRDKVVESETTEEDMGAEKGGENSLIMRIFEFSTDSRVGSSAEDGALTASTSET